MWLHALRYIDDLPDSGRLGVRLMASAFVIGAIPFAWAHFGPEQYEKATLIAVGFRPPSSHIPFGLDSLRFDFLCLAAICFACGAFIFFRKAVLVWGEHRDEKVITRLNLK